MTPSKQHQKLVLGLFLFLTFLRLWKSQCVIYTAYHTVTGYSDWLLDVCFVGLTPSISILISVVSVYFAIGKRQTSFMLHTLIIRC